MEINNKIIARNIIVPGRNIRKPPFRMISNNHSYNIITTILTEVVTIVKQYNCTQSVVGTVNYKVQVFVHRTNIVRNNNNIFESTKSHT